MKYVIKSTKIIDAGNMAGDLSSSTATNAQTDHSVSFLDNIGLQFIWTGTPTGVISVSASNDNENFTTLEFSPEIEQPAGSASSGLANLNQFPYRYIKVSYTRTSGSGSLTVWMSGREI